MAETGSVASVASAGLRLALLLNAVACQVANLGVDIHSISKGITLFSTSLKQVRQSLQSEHSVHTQECLDTANQISDQALAVFEEVEDMLDKVQKPGSQTTDVAQSIQQRFKVCFKKQRVTYLLAQLESLKLSLMLILQVLQLGRLMEVKNVLNTLTEELIGQERADAQNMLIVRYWSTKKLDRLWELARQEALDAKEDRAPTVRFESDPPSMQDQSSPASPTMSKLPIIPLGVEKSLNSVEESPKDMLRLTGAILDALLKRWIREEVGQRLVIFDAYNTTTSSPRASVSSGSEEGFSDDGDDRPNTRGYYLEGTTTDWRKPHSQDARAQAARLRKLYSTKQAYVHSDSEDSENSASSSSSSRWKAKRPDGGGSYTTRPSGDSEYTEPASRPYSYSFSNKVPASDTDTNWRHEDLAKPQYQTQTRPIPVPQPNAHTSSLRPPTSNPSSARNGAHQHQSYYSNTAPNGSQSCQQQVPRYTPAPPSTRAYSRSMSDNLTVPQPQQYFPPSQQQQQQQQLQPPRHRSSRSRKGHHSPQPYDRHRDLKRTAMRGILGASAIGGFMDALEAFSVI